MKNNKYTFWKLIQENIIEIPIIQRDYAQGRNNKKTKRIRENFLNILHKIIENEDSSVNLDFVYGKIEGEYLIPLDGQQRLTTLFLLHWYLAIKDDKLEENKIFLSNFTYETRVSSREFCKALVNNKIELDKEKISIIIEDKNWFYKSWKKDPTIKSMLQMIDDIHLKFKDTNGFFNKLICAEKPPITFDFLPLNEFKLTDELYIKMNARGKPLTDYEDFKAKFVELLTGNDVKKLDNDWTDFFWKYKISKDDGYYYIDDKFLNFFTVATMNFYLEQKAFSFTIKTKIDEISIFDIYEDVYSDKNNIDRIIQLLDSLIKCKNTVVMNMFETIIGHNDNKNYSVSYPNRVKFYVLSQFLIEYGEINDHNQEKFLKWTRVTWNLINNSLIQSLDNFMHAIRSIKEISLHMDDLYNYLSTVPHIDYFLQVQVKEEIIKAILILKNDTWEKRVLEIEHSIPYFEKQIGFLLSFSGIENYFDTMQNCNWDIQNDDQYKKMFDQYCKTTKLIFGANGLKEEYENYIFERALLTYGDYLLSALSNDSFLINEGKLARDIGWKRLLRDDDIKRSYVQKLFNNLKMYNNENDMKAKLLTIIDGHDVDDWRKYFIKYPGILKVCGTNKFIRRHNDYDILLLEKKRTSAVHREYYTYALYLELKSQNKQVVYREKKSIDELKYVELGDKKVSWNKELMQYEIENQFFTFDEILVM